MAPLPLKNRHQVLHGARRRRSLPGNPIVAELVRFESAIHLALQTRTLLLSTGVASLIIATKVGVPLAAQGVLLGLR